MIKIKKPNILKIIEKIINSKLINVQIDYRQLGELLSNKEIEKSLNEKIIEINIKRPRKCKNCSNTDIDILEESDLYNIKCKNCSSFYTESIEENTYYRLHYLKIAEHLLRFLGLSNIKLNDEDFYISGIFEWKNQQFSFIFLPTIAELDYLLPPFFEISKKRGNILCIISDQNFDEILKLYSCVTLGKTIKIVPISILNPEEIYYWLNISLEIKKLEDKIIKELKEERKKLVISINTNPKYALILLDHLKTLKKIKNREFDYKLLEDMTSIVIQQFFPSDPTFGGGQSIGKDLPDNIFIVNNERGDPEIFGLIDCKSSEKANLNRDPSEKYLNYIKKVKERVSRSLKVAMIFLVFDIKINSVLKFYDRIEKKLNEDDYIIILPVDTLIIILEVYLNMIIQGEFKRKGYYDNFEYYLRNIFNNKYLNQLKDQYNEENENILTKTKLYRLNPKDTIEEIKTRLKINYKSKEKKILSVQEEFMKRYGNIE